MIKHGIFGPISRYFVWIAKGIGSQHFSCEISKSGSLKLDMAVWSYMKPNKPDNSKSKRKRLIEVSKKVVLNTWK